MIAAIGLAAASRKGLLRDLVEVFVLAIGLYILATTTVQTVRVVGTSMYPSLHDGDLLIASKVDYRIHPIERGDIVILKDPLDPSRDFIKRVVGLPGDRIQIRDHHVLVNGGALSEPYVRAPWVQTGDWPGPGAISIDVVPSGSYFVLGDNRDHSSDSRVFGRVRQDAIDGKAVVRFWPFPRAEVLNLRPTLTNPHPFPQRSGAGPVGPLR
ncbi:MAG TPA: signal peptidase I [Candidatus Dormibacteraeota bacterium]